MIDLFFIFELIEKLFENMVFFETFAFSLMAIKYSGFVIIDNIYEYWDFLFFSAYWYSDDISLFDINFNSII